MGHAGSRNVRLVFAAWPVLALCACGARTPGAAGQNEAPWGHAGAVRDLTESASASLPEDAARAPPPEHTAIPIVVAHDESIFPELWRAPPISARAEPVDEARARHARGVIEAAMRKYPPGLLEGHINGVHLVGRLHFSGIVAGGTNSSTRVYVAVGDVRKGYTDRSIERIFHAEVSSILLRNRANDFDEAAWRAINPPGFVYLGHGTEAIRRGKVGQLTRSDLLDEGFFGDYAQSTLENDFNSFACFLLTGDPAVWVSAQAHPRITAKRQLTIDFYRRLNPALNEAHFRSLRR